MYKVLIRIPLLRNIVKYYDKHRSPVYFISFPKCGRTWVRMMLAKLLQKKYVDYDTPLLNIVEPKFRRPGFPGIKWVHDDSAHWKKPDELNKSKLNYKYKKVIFMVSDPMDVVVSLFF